MSRAKQTVLRAARHDWRPTRHRDVRRATAVSVSSAPCIPAAVADGWSPTRWSTMRQ